jgi:hypothetical protein
MALTVYYEGLKRINTILILVLLKNNLHGYIKIYWFGFSYLEQEHFDILPTV